MALFFGTINTFFGAFENKNKAANHATNIALVITRSLLMSLLIAAAAKLNVPVWPVPVTMQSFAVAALAAAFGMRMALAMVLLYLIERAIGLPVFATGGGILYFVGPTGGFLLGFLAQATIIGKAADGGALSRPFHLYVAMLFGTTVLYALGFVWLLTLAGQAAWVDQSNILAYAFSKAVIPFVVWDILKMALATLLSQVFGSILLVVCDRTHLDLGSATSHPYS